MLILYVRAGVGHERAARAVARALIELDPACRPIVRDALEFASPLLRATYASLYNRVASRVPRVWGYVYHGAAKARHGGFRQRVRTRLTLWNCRAYAEVARKLEIDAIFCTQFLPAEVYGFLRERRLLNVPVTCAITDFAVHPIWVYRGVDRYFVAANAVKEELAGTGEVPWDRIEVTGMPIDPRFATAVDPREARAALGLDPDPSRTTILVMGGGFGWGPIEGVLDIVLSLPPKAQALVIAGRNERLKLRLEERARGQEGRIRVHGFSDRVDLFLAASDLLVGKSGGLTASEAMARGVPMVVFRPIPGQEERNCDFLQESGAAVRVHNLDELHFRLRHFLADPAHLGGMKVKAAGVGRPRAAYAVARSILDSLTPPGAGARLA